MISFIQKLLAKIPQALRWPLLLFVAVALVLLIWLKGVNAWNSIGNWWAQRGTDLAHSEIQKIKEEAAASKKVAEDAIAAFEAEKKLTAEERKKRELAEALLADKTKNTDQKLKAYEAAISKRPTVSGPESIDELCERAKSLGISCD